MMNTRLFLLSVVAVLGLLVVSCKKTDDVVPNSPPGAFTVTPRLAANGVDVILNWTKAKDPNGDPVTYAVVYKDTLVRNLADTTYTIRGVGYAMNVIGTVVASDNQKARTTSAFSIVSGANPYAPVPDVNFEKALIALKIDDVQDGRILIANAQKTTSLDVSSASIANMQGIEAFTNLTTLYCYYNALTALDVSKNTKLDYLDCSPNSLTALNVTQNTVMTFLDCSYNNISTLDVTKNTALTYFDCATNNLATLDLTKNILLTSLSFSSNKLSLIDISKNTKVTALYARANALTALDVSNNPALTYITCSANNLPALDVSKNVNLSTLYCYSNKMTAIDVTKNTSLGSLYCYSNKLTALDVSKNSALSSLDCTANTIQNICVSSLSQPKSGWLKDASSTYKVCP